VIDEQEKLAATFQADLAKIDNFEAIKGGTIEFNDVVKIIEIMESAMNAHVADKLVELRTKRLDAFKERVQRQYVKAFREQ
jgi:hypothetical protein